MRDLRLLVMELLRLLWHLSAADFLLHPDVHVWSNFDQASNCARTRLR